MEEWGVGCQLKSHPHLLTMIQLVTPVGLGRFDLLPVGRRWLGAHCKFSDALSSPNRGKTKAQCYGISF
ncbi:hypothetical protein TNCV_3489811 [Trichonephila clavipes]|nr:hypothetical protein TNCV_3489811 [Trichonephila clavipes]